MKLEYAELIAEARDASLKPFEVKLRPDYSGRAMYGETTAAIIAPSMAEFAAAACAAASRLARDGEWCDRLIDAVRAVRTDSMGRDSIVIY